MKPTKSNAKCRTAQIDGLIDAMKKVREERDSYRTKLDKSRDETIALHKRLQHALDVVPTVQGRTPEEIIALKDQRDAAFTRAAQAEKNLTEAIGKVKELSNTLYELNGPSGFGNCCALSGLTLIEKVRKVMREIRQKDSQLCHAIPLIRRNQEYLKLLNQGDHLLRNIVASNAEFLATDRSVG